MIGHSAKYATPLPVLPPQNIIIFVVVIFVVVIFVVVIFVVVIFGVAILGVGIRVNSSLCQITLIQTACFFFIRNKLIFFPLLGASLHCLVELPHGPQGVRCCAFHCIFASSFCLPNPKSLRCFRAKRLCSCQKGPFVATIPKLCPFFPRMYLS